MENKITILYHLEHLKQLMLGSLQHQRSDDSPRYDQTNA